MKKHTIGLLALIFSFLSSGLSAQNLYIKTDSLQKALPSLKGVERREAMRQIIEYSEEFSKDISKEYSLRLFEEAKMVGDTFYMIEGLYNLGMVEKLDGNFFQANQY
ncbi:MAG: hypothetical protein WBJ48_09110, partial [Bacteroidales bacterium]